MTDYSEKAIMQTIMHRWPMTVWQPRFVTAVQVHDGAGFDFGRRLDAIVFDTWPSKGLTLHGLEIKTSRADLRRELQSPTKRGGWSAALDKFSIVAPKGMVDKKVLPAEWGLYLVSGKVLRCVRKPLMLHAELRPDMSRSLAAAFVRALVDRSLSKEELDAEYQRGRRDMAEEASGKSLRTEHRIRELEQAIESFEEASGVRLNPWQAGPVGEAVRLVLKGHLEGRIRYGSNLRTIGEKLVSLADQLEGLRDAMARGDPAGAGR